MKPSLHIDLRQRQGTSRVVKILVLVLLLLVIYQAGDAISLRDDIATLEQQAQAVTHGAPPTAASEVPPANTPDQLVELRQIRAQLLMPWEPILDAITDNAGPAVALRSVRPDPATLQADISGVARNREDFLSYIERLRSDRHLRDAEALGDEPNRTQNTTTSDGVLFRVRVRWGAMP